MGAMTRPMGQPFAAPFSAMHLASTGRRNPKVLPLPVLAMARMSRPVTAMGQAADQAGGLAADQAAGQAGGEALG